MHHPTDRILYTTAFVTPVVEHWPEGEINQNDFLASMRYNMLCKKDVRAKAFAFLKDCPQHPQHVNFSPCGHITRLWSALAEVMKWSCLNGDGG